MSSIQNNLEQVGRYIQQGAHDIVSNVADDLRDNTITTVVGSGLGAVKGAATGVKVAKEGVQLFIKKSVVAEGTKGAVKGGVIGGVLGDATTSIINKVSSIEKAFDNTKIGKGIDNGITAAENGLHKLIGGGYN